MNDLITMPKPDIDSIFDSLDVGENTRHEYRLRIIPFLAFVQTEGLSLNILLDYKRLLAKREDYVISTKNKNLVVAKVFLRECHRLGLIERDITSNVKCFKQDKRHKVDGLNDEEVSLISQWVKDNPHKLRERAMLCLLLLNGLRQFEVCNIKLKDLDLKAGRLSVIGKGRDDYERIHLHPNTTRALRRYCRTVKLQSDDYLFTSKRRQSKNRKLTTRGLQLIIKGIFLELEIDRTVHGCRHYFVTRLIKTMPGNLTIIAKFSRHESLEMLKIYDDSLLMEQSLEQYRKAFNDLKI
ncbi:MAG TPA: site-specific integrase [Candidatus Saccharimonadales bacterium]|nr:site-specific integrase [Candidatus Saccharimonadales bacterium]